MQPVETPAPSDVVSAFVHNDEPALESIYNLCFPKARDYILCNSGTYEQALDTYQDSFLALWRNIRDGKFIPRTIDDISAYLTIIVRNKWVDYLRSFHHRMIVSEEELPGWDLTEEELVEDERELIELIKKEFAKLGEKCRDLLSRYYYRRQRLVEIAADLNYTEATVRNNKYRCLRKLRELVLAN